MDGSKPQSRFFYFVLLVTLTGDMLLSFTATILVYAHTQDIAMSGLVYAMEWSSRLLLIPLIGRWVDTQGIRQCAIFFDSCKIVACLLFWRATYMIETPTTLAITTGVFCGLIALSNAQTLIVYEKYVADLDKLQPESRLDAYANLISKADQFAMVLGPLLGFFLFKKSLTGVMLMAMIAYLTNLYFFVTKRYAAAHRLESPKTPTAKEQCIWTGIGTLWHQERVLIGTLMLIVTGNFFSNMLDGTVEAAGVAVVFEQMHQPIEYYAFILIAAGGVGVVATMLFSKLYRTNKETLLLLSVVLLEGLAGVGLLINFHNFISFIFFYALCIGSKIIRGTLTRLYRMRTLPSNLFASVSSLMTVLGQLSLPLVGLLLYNAPEHHLRPQYIILVWTVIILACSLALYMRWTKSTNKNIAIASRV